MSDRDRRTNLGWAASAAGVLAIVWATLVLANAGYGSRPGTEFAERRSYNMVKRDVHDAMPVAALLGVGGVALLFAGGWLRRKG